MQRTENHDILHVRPRNECVTGVYRRRRRMRVEIRRRTCPCLDGIPVCNTRGKCRRKFRHRSLRRMGVEIRVGRGYAAYADDRSVRRLHDVLHILEGISCACGSGTLVYIRGLRRWKRVRRKSFRRAASGTERSQVCSARTRSIYSSAAESAAARWPRLPKPASR